LLLANGASGVTIDEGSYPAFLNGLLAVCRELALGIVRGGEGATNWSPSSSPGAASPRKRGRAAKAIANSPLVKTAIHGGDPNWGV
jgi:glutamate N-acetyltransferase/amino-acid N-acetyltransferase